MSKLTSTKRAASQTLVMPPVSGRETMRVRKTKLLIVSGPLQGQEMVIDKEAFTLGSGTGNDLVIADSTISKRHCEITVDGSGYTIRDLGSTNGTVVQGVRVAKAYLHPGAELCLGKTHIVFCPLQEDKEIPLSRNESFGSVLGRSAAMRRIFYIAETYAPTDATVMITGETGTGKEILAEEIHRHSKRRNKPFIVIDCAAMAKDLIESELFGHVKGAFTGANADRQGAFEHADGGTVFLDEIGDLSPDLQPKLLRVLEKREIRRVGSNKVRKIDVRIICATNRKLDVEVNEGRFREDLYYRLSVVPIELPPLRRRLDDLPILIKKFLVDFHGPGADRQIADFDGTMELLRRHEWPGNVRELRNLVEMASYGAQRPVDLGALLSFGRLRGMHDDEEERGEKAAPMIAVNADRPFKDAKNELIGEFERKYLQGILARNGGDIAKSAREAGIDRAAFQRLVHKYGLK